MLNLWRRYLGRRVFISYREREAKDNALAQTIAAGLTAHGFRVILETDKHDPKVEAYRYYHQLLAGSEAVVAIVSATTKDSSWIFFEALTAKQQDKLHLVAFEGVEIDATLLEGNQAVLKAERFQDAATRGAAIQDLVTRIRESSKRARVYRSVPGLFLQARRLGAALIALVVAVMTFIVLFDSARKAVCAHENMATHCVAAGWPAPPSEPST